MKAVRFGFFPLLTSFALLALIVVAAFLAVFPQAGSSPVSASGSVKVVLEDDSAGSLGTFTGFGPPDVNDAGRVAFYGRTTSGAYGVFRDDLLTFSIANDGMTPEGPLAFGPTFGEPVVISSATAGNYVAFSAVIGAVYGSCLGPPPCKAIFKGNGVGVFSVIAAQTQPAPGGGTLSGAPGGPSGVTPTLLDFNDVNQALYASPVAGTSYTYALYLSGWPTPVAYVGETLPSGAGGGTITGFGREDGAGAGSCNDNLENGTDGAIDLLDPDCRFAAVDNAGRVVFHATVSGGSSPEGIYLRQAPAPAAISAVARTGYSTWEGDPGFGATLTAVGQPSINDSNQVAFYGTSSGPYGSGYFLASLSSPHEDGSASCFDNLDNGGDGAKDAGDADCTSSTNPYEDGNASCTDGIDNGGDTVVDANDPDCQLVAAKQVLANDPSVVGDTFGGGGGCAYGLRGGLGPNRLNDGGQVVVGGCGGDPTYAIITVPQFHKQVITTENLGGGLGSVVTIGNASISKGSATMDSQLAFAASVSAGGCASTPCDGLFKVQNSCTVDNDGDGLNNCWENNGIDINNDNTVDLDLPAMGANANRKDIFVEADYMDCGQKGCESEDGAGLGTCGDGIDNGADGTKDLADADCNVVGADTHTHKPIAATVWNYEDGAGPNSCADGKDNGKDGTCDNAGCGALPADPDCSAGIGAGTLAEDGFPPGTCTDNIDNGGDTVKDNADPDCKVGTVVDGFANAPVANPFLGPTGISLHVIVDEAIPHRQYMNFWVPEDGTASCFDGIDNSGDGMCDSGGPACGGLPADPDCGRNGIGFEDENTSCNDGIDNGADGKIDAADPDCGVYDFDAAGGKPTYFGTATERASANWKWIKKAKRQVFHYVIYTHQQAPGGTEDGSPISLSCGDGIDNGGDGKIDAADTDCKGVGSSGIAEIWGNDFMVSLGAFAHEDGKQAASCFNGIDDGADGNIDLADSDCTSGVVGDQDEQEGTFMHELGHNLNLRHGGMDNINYKPNYLSIMNYTFQFDWNVGAGNRPLDYSRWWLPIFGASANEDGKGAGLCQDGIDNGGDGLTDGADPDCQGLLNETDLNEDRGIDTWVAPVNPTGWNTIWKWTAYSVYDPASTKCLLSKVSIVGAIDWDADTVVEGNTVAAPNNNNVIAFPNDPRGPGGAMCASDPEKLLGFDDWPTIKYDFRPAADYSDGLPNAPLPPDEALPNEAAPTAGAVGGIAELPDMASGSGSSTGTFAALAGGLAAAIVTIIAGTWYARRRWLR